MYIGTMHGLDIWIVMVDQDLLAPDAKLDPAGKTYLGHTVMSTIHRRMVLTWLLHILSEAGINGIFCDTEDMFDVNLEAPQASWTHAVNFEYVSSITRPVSVQFISKNSVQSN
jgi:hypothetical protein